MSDALRSFVFAAVLCVTCSLLLTAASTGLKARQMRNVAVDRQKNILLSVGLVEEERGYGADEIETLYRQNMRALHVDGEGRVVDGGQAGGGYLPVYVYARDERIEAYVVPVDTRGLWGRIHGYMAFENDGSTVRGFTVYKHTETPGLGGEIERQWFRKNFEGKKIVGPGGDFVSVQVAKGRVEDAVPSDQQAHYVDGISGATMTGRFLSEGLNDLLRDYEPVAVKFRNNEPGTMTLGNALR